MIGEEETRKPEAQEPEPASAPEQQIEHAAAPEQPSSNLPVEAQLVEALPALARVAAGMWLRAAAWGVGTSLRAGARLAQAATDPNAALDLYTDASGGFRSYAREFLGITEIDDRVKLLAPLAGSTLRSRNGDGPDVDLRAQGAELLRQAADVDFDEGAHPSYARILTELAPDEARILRLLALDGAQPVVDVRAANLIGLGSQLIAPALNMIGAQAGVRHRERVPAYLSNLSRLGLIFLSEEPIGDPSAYQVLEAQPEVLGLMKETTRAKSIHRSVHLTPFGADFCETVLPLDVPGLPSGSSPPQLPSGGDEQETF
jgi:Abortive infection alpha